MPRNMSFMATTEAVRLKTKRVTRRLGWQFLKPGDIFQPCEKCQGLGKGGKIVKIGGLAEVLSVKREPLVDLHGYPHAEVVAEGFPHLSHEGFIGMFCKLNNCERSQEVTRITFQYL